MRDKFALVIVILLFCSLIPTTIAEEESKGPEPQPPYIEHFTVNPPWSYKDSIHYFWCHYFDLENRTITTANIFIDNISYPLWHNTTNTTLESPNIGKNFTHQAEQPWERKTYEFYFQINTNTTITNSTKGYFDIVNREPYSLRVTFASALTKEDTSLIVEKWIAG